MIGEIHSIWQNNLMIKHSRFGSYLLLCLMLLASLVLGTACQSQSQPPPHLLLTQAHKPDAAVASWITLGDTGSAMSSQFQIAARMKELSDKRPVDAMIIVGDVVYEKGDVATFGEARFKKPYKPLTDKGIPIWTALGNHDVVGGHGPEAIQYYGMPARYYAKSMGKVGEGLIKTHPLVEFFIIDSNTFSNDAPQKEWLSNALQASKARWKFVAGHHPIYSSGEHGFNPEMQKALEPILTKYKVTGYLAGHDHDYERFKLVKGVFHVVTGGGGASLREFKTIMPQSLVRKSINNFLYFTATPTQITMEAIDKTGKKFDSVVIK